MAVVVQRVAAARGRAPSLGWGRPAAGYAAYLVASALFAFPFLWALSGSLKTPYQIEEFPPRWIPDPVMWGNYTRIWEIVPLGRSLWNTVLISLLSLLGQVATAAMVAYGFARFR